MIKHRLVQFSYLCIITMLLGACYSYGPTHKPYGYSKRTPEYKAAYLKNTFEQVKQQLPDAEIQLMNDSIKILFPEAITYNLQEIVPSEEYKNPLNELVKLLLRRNETDLLIAGHCDNTGKAEFNKKLSEKRAGYIKDYLASIGMPLSRMEHWGLGSNSPIADNTTPEGRRKNRRVEFVVLYADGLHWGK